MSATGPRWLFIVAPGRHDLYTQLARRLRGLALVIEDRRRAERRQTVAVSTSERRRRERRRPLTTKEEVQTSLAGYRAIYRTTGLALYQAEEATPAPCPDCGEVFEFDMPRFHEVPTRIDIEVVHLASKTGIRHVVDLEATAAADRPLVACRLRARPYRWPITAAP
jgi:hypothetical protein